jgi:hypothetical protein
VRQYQPTFPVGMASQLGAIQYMQLSPMIRTFVPYIVFIDREGIIRHQLTGGELSDATQEKTLREIALSMVNQGQPSAKPKAKKATQ